MIGSIFYRFKNNLIGEFKLDFTKTDGYIMILFNMILLLNICVRNYVYDLACVFSTCFVFVGEGQFSVCVGGYILNLL